MRQGEKKREEGRKEEEKMSGEAGETRQKQLLLERFANFAGRH